MYFELEAGVRDVLRDEDKVCEVMACVRRVMAFDPHASRYTPELGRKTVEARRALRVGLGVSEAQLRAMRRAEREGAAAPQTPTPSRVSARAPAPA